MKQPRSMAAFLFVVFACVPGSAHATPRIAPDPFFTAAGNAEEPLSVDTLIEVSLRASGAQENEAARAGTRIRELIAKMTGEIDPGWAEREKAEFVLTFLHENMFRMYDEFQTRIDRVVGLGSFNCVSSAVLYMIFARSVDIPVIGIGTSDHAFCAVLLSEGRVDVETTSIYGFDPGKKREFHDAFGNITGYSYVPPSQYSGRSDLTGKQLLALILQNRISMLESRKQYTEALELAVDRYALSPDEMTLGHLVRSAINYAALSNERKEYQGAIEFLNLFVDSYGWSESLRDIFGILHYNQVVVLIQSGALSEALDAMNELEAPGWLSAEVLSDLRSQVAERILAKQLPALTTGEGLTLLEGLRDEGLLTSQRYVDFAVMLVSKEADAAAVSGDYLAAATVIDDAMTRLGPDRRLRAARDAYRYNFAVEAHNAFAALFNDGRYDEAAALLREAVSKVPEIRILIDDQKALESVLSSSP